MAKGKILIVDDEATLLESLEMSLEEKGYEVACALNASKGLGEIDSFDPDVIVLDIRLPDINGLDVLRELKKRGREKRTIIITAFHDMETTINAIKLGAHDYIPKPIDMGELEHAIGKVLKLHHSAPTISFHETSRGYEPGEIIGKSRVMKDIFKSIGMLSENNVTVLIQGETGTGKELIARAIHFHSARRNEPFVAINCSAIVGTLLESELFGHERGAFTHAVSAKRGKFELAGEGTIFLDEIGEITMDLQPKLLRFLQEREFERVGGERTLRSNARVVAATNKNLWQMVKEGSFRVDLYYRLSVATINVPPLRDRRSDIPLLIESLMGKIGRELKMHCGRIEKEAVSRLSEYEAPGNVRELENILTRAAVMANGGAILEEHVAPMLAGEEAQQRENRDSLERMERDHILKVLQETRWHYGRACDILGISRPTLREKIRKYKLPQPS